MEIRGGALQLKALTLGVMLLFRSSSLNVEGFPTVAVGQKPFLASNTPRTSFQTSNVQKEGATQTPAEDRGFLLLPVLKAAKIMGALMYMKSFHKNPFFQLDIDVPSSEQYYGNSYTTPSPPPKYPPKDYYPPPPRPMSYGKPHEYKEQPYSEEEYEDECENEEMEESAEDQCC